MPPLASQQRISSAPETAWNRRTADRRHLPRRAQSHLNRSSGLCRTDASPDCRAVAQPRLFSLTSQTKQPGRSTPVHTGTSRALAASTRPGSMLMIREASGKNQ